jgi:Tol biopolymer transport system component
MIKDDHQGGLFLYDINTKEKSPLKTAKNVTSAKINDAYRSYAFSNDNKSVFYFSEDRKSILKYEIASNSESKVISGPKTLLYFKLSNDSSKIAFGYWYDDNKGIYVVDVSSGEKKKVFEAGSDCECSPNVLAWGKDDKYLYFKEGKFRNLKKINRINIDGGEPEEVLVFKDIFQYGDITQVNIHPDEKSVLVELSVGKEEIWKLEGIFND